MFIRIKFPNEYGSINYIIAKEFQFSRTISYDVYHLAQIFSQSPILFMIMGSDISFNISGSLFIKNSGSDYVVDGIYNSSFNQIVFVSIRHIINYLNAVTKKWNDGTKNTNTSSFAIQFVDNYNDPDDYSTIQENFLPESFSYSISSRDPMIINISMSGKIGVAMT